MKACRIVMGITRQAFPGSNAFRGFGGLAKPRGGEKEIRPVPGRLNPPGKKVPPKMKIPPGGLAPPGGRGPF